MNPVEKFDKSIQQFTFLKWRWHVHKIGREFAPTRVDICSLIFCLGSLGLLALLFPIRERLFTENALYIYLFIILAVSLTPIMLVYVRALKHSLKRKYNFEDAPLNSLERKVKLKILKEELFENSKEKDEIVTILENYVENLLSYPVGGVILRHPLSVTTIVTLPISFLVSLTVLVIRLDNDTNLNDLWQLTKLLFVLVSLLLLVFLMLSPIVDYFVLGRRRFLQEMRELLIMLEADLKANNENT